MCMYVCVHTHEYMTFTHISKTKSYKIIVILLILSASYLYSVSFLNFWSELLLFHNIDEAQTTFKNIYILASEISL